MEGVKDMEDKDFSIIVFCAFRYALGRMTYIPHIVSDFIKEHIEKITNKHIYLMIHEIDEYYEANSYIGMRIDTDAWLNLKEFLEIEMEKRHE